MEALIFIQQESLDKLRRTVREFKKMPDDITHNFVMTKLEVLEQDFKEFKEGHKEIIAKASKERTESYFTDEVYEDFEKLYVRYKTMLKEELDDISDEEYYADKYDDRDRRRSYDSRDSRDSHDSHESYDSRGNRTKEKTSAKAKATLSVSFKAKSKKSSECKLCFIC